jgi:GTP-binding protein HflX
VLCVGDWRSPAHRDAQLAEITGLVEARGHSVIGRECLRVPRVNARSWLGRGQAEAVAARARERGATLLVLDAQLSPSQARNLEALTGLSVSDREIVILGVFHRHARSRAARIQVEIAHLQYLRPRIRGLGLNMDQQAGGVMQGKGAGETASELMARRLDGRLVALERSLVKIQAAAGQRRRGREGAARVALVGYTNAGKTSLMNALSGEALSTRSRPFETLDTTSRCLTRHGGSVLLSDTVGFIRDLPDRLLASFASTLAEAADASLLAVVVDLSDPEWPMHLATTDQQLQAIGAGDIPRFTIFNKRDLVEGPLPRAELLAAAGPRYAALSSRDPEAVAALRARLIAEARRGAEARAAVFVPYAEAALSAEIHRGCRVLDCRPEANGMVLEIAGPARLVARICQRAEVRS